MKRGCGECEQWMEHCYWDHHSQTKRFLRTLTRDFSKRLKLPKKFSTYFKDNEIQTVHLEDSTGDKWNMSLTERKGNLCLDDGWYDFVNSHHLIENDTLHFEYKLDTGFNVSIFDESGCEKESAYYVKNKCKAKDQDVPQLSPPRGTNILFPKPEPVETSDQVEKKENVECSSRKRTKKCVEFPRRTLVPSALPSASAFELANAFKPEKPSFVIVMKKTPVSGYNMVLNTEFSKKHLSESKVDMMRLRIPGKEEEWKVKLRIYPDKYVLFGGWIHFARDNSLQVGDVLVFELVCEDMFDVHIFRTSHD